MKAFATKAMKTKEVRIDTDLNKLLWSKGVKVRLEAALRRWRRRTRALCVSSLPSAFAHFVSPERAAPGARGD